MSYPLPTWDDLICKLQGSDTFVIVDLNQAYLQLKLDDEAKKLLVINTPWILFSNSGMAFGLICASFIFKRFMDTTLSNFHFVEVYLDDVIISGKGIQERYERTCQILNKFRELNIKVKEKWQLFKTQVPTF